MFTQAFALWLAALASIFTPAPDVPDGVHGVRPATDVSSHVTMRHWDGMPLERDPILR